MQQHYKYNGLLNIYKEAGWTSMDVCARLRSILHVKKIGHAGTLDPMAEGVLPVALGRATKSLDAVGEGIKEYRAGMLLGKETDTEDVTGTVLSVFDGILPSEEAVREAVLSFTGSYDQLSPMYSARKVNGKKLYEYARAGVEVERKSRNVSIYSIQIEEMDLPHVRFTVQCSQGTYIRSLCRDIGEKLGCGACMESLVRSRVGSFRIEDAVRIPEVAEAEKMQCVDALLRVAAPTAVSIGKFDGTHIGHQALFRELRKTAEELHLRTLVLILKFGKTTVLPDEDRKQKLYDLGIDYCIELEFTEEMKNMSAEEFLEKVLIGRFHMKAIVAGKDVTFGRGKAGNADFLYANAEKYGYAVKLIEKVTAEDTGLKTNGTGESHEISSTMLRECIRNGEMERAAVLLGEPFFISGQVVHGKGYASSKMKYPTMNLEVPENLTLPPFGVYAVRCGIAGKDGLRTVNGIANLGERPTVNGSIEGGSRLRLEVHAFGEIGDCYGMEVRVDFCRFIRSERKFEDLDALMKQIREHDLPEAEAYFRENS